MTPAGKKALKVLAAFGLVMLFSHYAWESYEPPAAKNSLSINLREAFGGAVKNGVTAEICHKMLPECRYADADNGTIILDNLPAGLTKPYEVKIRSSSYKDFDRSVLLPPEGQVTLNASLRLRPNKVQEINFPSYAELPDTWRAIFERSTGVAGLEGKSSSVLYDELDNERRAALMNILAKSQATKLPDQSTLLSHIREVIRIESDRIYFTTTPYLDRQMEEGADTGIFNRRGSLKSIMHKAIQGYEKTGSFKTPDARGILNLEMYSDGQAYYAELDIDEYSGLRHGYEVSRNVLFNVQTNPYDVAQMLYLQGIDPLYRFNAGPVEKTQPLILPRNLSSTPVKPVL